MLTPRLLPDFLMEAARRITLTQLSGFLKADAAPFGRGIDGAQPR